MMVNEQHLCREMSFATLQIDIYPVGDDIFVLLKGGVPHIGCTVLSAPRPSLAKNSLCSCTSSVINVSGHKDEILCRKAAEYICRKYNAVVVCTGGFHVDHITEAQITEVITELSLLLQQIG